MPLLRNPENDHDREQRERREDFEDRRREAKEVEARTADGSGAPVLTWRS